MTDQEMRVAIAEACGWKRVDLREDYHAWVKDGSTDLPDFPNDLNAMSEAEETLTPLNAMVFRLKLQNNSDGPNAKYRTVEAAMCHATARERAEAFLRTCGKWRDA